MVEVTNQLIANYGVFPSLFSGSCNGQRARGLADAMSKAHDLGRDLVLAIKKEKRFPEGEARVQERKELFKNLVNSNKDIWQFQYGLFWKERGETKP